MMQRGKVVQLVLFNTTKMRNAKSNFEALNEFAWDIIGYLLPGSYLLYLLSVCINKEYSLISVTENNYSDFSTFVFVVLSYILGHAVYGYSNLKEEILGKHSYTKKIEVEIS